MQWVQVFYNILRNISLKITFIRLDVAQKSARRVGVKKGALTLSSNSVSQSLRPVSLRRPRPSSKSLASRRIRLPSFRSFIVVSFLFFVLHFFLRSQSPSRRPFLHNQVQRRQVWWSANQFSTLHVSDTMTCNAATGLVRFLCRKECVLLPHC